MAKVHLDRLKKRYGIEDIKGQKYSEIIKLIIDNNNQNVENKMARLSQKKWENMAKKISTKEKRMVLPEMKDILPPRALSVAKSAEKGKLITDTLRDSLTRDLRMSLDEFSASGKDSYIRARGATAGRINPQLIKSFEEKIKGTFNGYTKKDPKLGKPPATHRIAVTEVRSAINNIKNNYLNNVMEKNPDLEAKKKWIHNKHLSKEPRKGHIQMDGKIVGKNESFRVPRYKMVGGSLKLMGYDYMKFPHDPEAPAEQVIQCNCDYDILISRRRK